jgi:pimeloyl-ACP methyl ester carboxylesterase
MEEVVKTNSASKSVNILLIVALVMVLLGDVLASCIQTNGGTVTIKDVRFMGSNGTEMSGLLYIPQGVITTDATGATKINPAPGILAVHGYINSRETQDGFAIEYARRGYVVLALDQTGHGYSDPPALANGFGGPDGLAYLRSLDLVDKANIGISGHSMGGWAVVVAAQTFPNDYKSMVLEGSSTGTYGGKVGDATFPRNLGLIYSKYDEFAPLMWEVPIALNAGSGAKLEAQFATTSPVEPNKLYGSIADGTARYWYQPSTNHPGDTFSTAAIGDAIDWFQKTLTGGNNLPASNQIWYWKEIGNLIALAGFLLFLFPLGALLLRMKFFSDVAEPMPAAKPAIGWGWWLGAILSIGIPIATYYPLMTSTFVKLGTLTPQSITNVVMAWALTNAVIFLVLFLIWHFAQNRKAGGNFTTYGLTWENGKLNWKKIGKSLLLAIVVTFSGYLLLALTDFFFKTDFRIYVFAVKLFSLVQFKVYLGYLIPFFVYFLIAGMVINSQLRLDRENGQAPMWKAILVNVVLMALPYILLNLWEYIPLYAGKALPNDALTTIVMYQFIPLLGISGALSTYFFRKTGHVWVGAFLNTLLLVWIMVAGTAIQFPIK